MTQGAGPVSRRERPAKPALTREGIVSTALGVLGSEGLHKVTMRRLAQELDTGAASLYVYVRDTEELHAGMLDVLLGRIDVAAIEPPATAAETVGGGWRDQLWALVWSYMRVLFAQPGLARVALVTRLSGPNYLGIVDAALGLLLAGGADPGRASWAVDALLLNATASAVEHGTQAGTPGAEEQQAQLLAQITGAADRLPHIATVGAELVSGTGEQRSRWAFDALVNGVLTTPRPSELF